MSACNANKNDWLHIFAWESVLEQKAQLSNHWHKNGNADDGVFREELDFS